MEKYQIKVGKRGKEKRLPLFFIYMKLEDFNRKFKINSKYYYLIKEFDKLTGILILLNTSFNEDEPMVNTPEETVARFLRTKMDTLVVENCYIKIK